MSDFWGTARRTEHQIMIWRLLRGKKNRVRALPWWAHPPIRDDRAAGGFVGPFGEDRTCSPGLQTSTPERLCKLPERIMRPAHLFPALCRWQHPSALELLKVLSPGRQNRSMATLKFITPKLTTNACFVRVDFRLFAKCWGSLSRDHRQGR